MKRTKITLEISKTTVIRRRRKNLRMECADCGTESMMMTLEEATIATGLSAQELCGLIGESKLHFAEALGGVLMICPISLGEIIQDAPDS